MSTPRILVLEDEPIICRLVVEILEDANYHVVGVERPELAFDALRRDTFSLLVSDIHMPEMSGLDVLDTVRAQWPSLPVVLVTGAGTYENLREALARGADGIVMKPFTHAELRTTVVQALERARRTERELRSRLLTPTLASALANAIEARQTEISGHCERLMVLAVRFAVELDLQPNDIETVRLGAILHDVGKIGIPDRILLKPGPLADDERAVMQTHPMVGDSLLSSLDLLTGVRPIVRHHHERWDGDGYPDRLAGEAIPLGARIVALADSIEAMTAHRPYREPLAPATVLAELERGRGGQWEPALVDLALALVERGDLGFPGEGYVLGDAPDEEPEAPPAVLLVEDDERHAALAIEALQSAVAAVHVAHAHDLASAQELCRTWRWSVAVIDDDLPDGRGLDLVDALRRASPTLPILMLTAAGAESIAIEAFRRGASDYLVKDGAAVAELATRVRALLEAA